MNRALLTFLAATGLATACSNVGPTETIRNDIAFEVTSTSTTTMPDPETITLNLSEISIRFRSEEGAEYAAMPDPDKMQFGEASGSYENVLGGALAPEGEASVNIECGIYDISVTAAEATDPCVMEAGEANPFGTYLCFVDSVWRLSNTINPDTCPDFFVHSNDK